MTANQAEQAIRETGQRVQESYNQAYREWLKHQVTLSTGALALLVSLRSSYAPQNPQAGWLLAVCWCSLCAATLLGLLALYGEAQWHREFLEAVRRTALQALQTDRDVAAVMRTIEQVKYERPRRFRIAAGALALAVTALAAFAVLNQ